MSDQLKLAGKRVFHKTYGSGIITRTIDAKIYVKFEKCEEEKRFAYPECFQKFLKQVDDSGADIIAVDAAKSRFNQAYQEKQRQNDILKAYEGKHSAKKVSKQSEPVQLETFTSIEAFVQKYSKELAQEIDVLRNDGEKRTRLSDGQFISRNGMQFTYIFQADTEVSYPGDTQITIWAQTGTVSGHILYCEDFSVTLVSTADLGKTVSQIEIVVDSWRLLEALCKRLSELQERPDSTIVKALICDGKAEIMRSQEIMRGQEKAVELSLTQPITFVWGPPGTGKTETLSRIALSHIKQGRRVLMLSYSNVSVDGAAWRVFHNDPTQEPGKIVRYGYAKDPQLLEHPFLMANKLVLKDYPDLAREQNKLVERLKCFLPEQRKSPQYVELKQKAQKIKDALKDAEIAAVHQAKFVAATVSKAVVDQTIYKDHYDVVLFDEASMAIIPQIVFSASLAKENFVCLGDFSQLPPIVQSPKESILNVDIFQYCGITDAVAEECGHRWLCMLDTQYRMDPRISDFASVAMYRGLLGTAPTVKELRAKTVQTVPFEGQPVVLADLSGMMSVCSKLSDNSRINPLSAFISFGIALNAAKDNDVGMITPYQAQSRLLHALARDVAEAPIHKITCATVHQFQGSEQDVIVYDAVDCYRQKYPGILLTSLYNNYANRLFNVAMTRAKGKFIAVANVAYFENKMISPELMFAKLIKRCKYTPRCVGGSELLNVATPQNCDIPQYQSYHGSSGDQQFLEDILEAKREIRINIPGNLEQNAQYVTSLSQALYVAQSHHVSAILRTEHKRNLPPELQEYAIEALNICDPIAIIDKKIIWFGEPPSAADFISCGDTFVTRWRPVIRFDGKNTANCLYGLLEMNQTVDRAPDIMLTKPETGTLERYVQSHKICAQCGRPMKLKQTRKGGFFLSCSGYPECSYSEKVTKEFVNEYLQRAGGRKLRCKYDDTTLETRVGPNGVYLQCCGVAKHRYELNEI